MKISVKRKIYLNDSTLGELSINGTFFCDTLEDTVRIPFEKIPGVTAIPSGQYKLIIDFSNRFQKLMPHILDVPEFTGIRIHSGNTSADTEGCILVGTRSLDGLVNSRKAFEMLMNVIEDEKQIDFEIS